MLQEEPGPSVQRDETLYSTLLHRAAPGAAHKPPSEGEVNKFDVEKTESKIF